MKANHSKFLRRLAPILFSLALAVVPLHAQTDESYLPDGKPDAIAILVPPPLPGSPEQAADLDEVRTVYHSAGSNDIAAAYSEKRFSIFNFTPAIGGFFQPGKFPKTEVFFERVQNEAAAVIDDAKNFYEQPRPYVTDPSLANGKLETNFSYPSGH